MAMVESQQQQQGVPPASAASATNEDDDHSPSSEEGEIPEEEEAPNDGSGSIEGRGGRRRTDDDEDDDDDGDRAVSKAKKRSLEESQKEGNEVSGRRGYRDERSSGKRGRFNDDNNRNRGGRGPPRPGSTSTSTTTKAVPKYLPPAKRRQLMEEKKKEEDEKKQQQEDLLKLTNGGDGDGNGVNADACTGDGVDETMKNDGAEEEEEEDSESVQLESWTEQTRAIHGTINRLNKTTIKPLIQNLFQKVNLIRMKGVLCKNLLMATISSPAYADVYAALIAVINTKLPEVAELMVSRCILTFRKHYKRREKIQCQAVAVFLCHLFHQGVVPDLLVLELLFLLLDGNPTDDSVEVAIAVMRTSGQALLDSSRRGVLAVTERFRDLLHEGKLNKKVEYQVEELLKQRKNGFKDFPSVIPELDLVERDDQTVFEFTLDDEDLQQESKLDKFAYDPDYKEHQEEWSEIRAEILGEGSDSDSDSDDSDSDDDSSTDSGSGDDDGDGDDDEHNPDGELAIVPADASNKQITTTQQDVQDLTEADLVHLRRTIYLTIMSSATFEECAHKLARIDIPPGRESELVNMLIECCSQERTFLTYYGLVGARFCLLDERWRTAFMDVFAEQYSTIHRLETNKLRNVAKLFAHILHTDSIPWSVLSNIHLNEDETTSSSRIFIKIIIQEMAQAMGIAKLNERFQTDDEEQKLWYAGMFPKDNIRNTRYAINFFTSIGLGPLTDDMREYLKNAPKLIMAQAKQAEALAAQKKNDDDDSVSSSSVSSTSSSSSSSYSSSSSSSSSSSGSSRSSRSSSSSSSSYSSRSRRKNRRGSSSSRRRGKTQRRSSSKRRRSYSSGSDSSSGSSSSDDDDDRKRKNGSRGRKDEKKSSQSKSKTSKRDRGGSRRDSRSSRSRSRSSSPPREIIRKEGDKSD